MSLTSLWKSQKDELSAKHVQAMVGLTGDGGRRERSKASDEFREFLTYTPSTFLARHANECLHADKFSESGRALQDMMISEVGQRLGSVVQNGLYRGKVNDIGNIGLWRSDASGPIILEVKTTDTYSIDLDTLSKYRKTLAAQGRVELERASILIASSGATLVAGRRKSAALGTPWQVKRRFTRKRRLCIIRQAHEQP